MPKYIVMQSFVSTEIGPHAQDEIIELSVEQALNLPLRLLESNEGVIETAENGGNAESADLKPARKRKAG